jgi:hypothetical protein
LSLAHTAIGEHGLMSGGPEPNTKSRRVYIAEAPFADHLLSPAFLALRMTLFQDRAPRLDSSDEIPFAQFNTAVPQDVVGGGAVEIKVGQHEMHQIGLAFETQRVLTKS